jgi:ATP-dependent Lon protease
MFTKNNQTRGTLPSIAIRGMAPFPSTDVRTEVGRSVSKQALLEAERNHDNHVLLLIQENPLIEDADAKDMLPIGVVAKIGIKIKLPSGNFKVKFDPIVRATIESFDQMEPYILTTFETLPSIQDDVDEEIALVRMIVKMVMDNGHHVLNNPKQTIEMIQSGVSSEKLADIVASNLKISEKDKYKYITTPELTKRLNFLIQDIEKEKHMSEIEEKINRTVKKNIDENQREYYLREKLRAIQDPLISQVSNNLAFINFMLANCEVMFFDCNERLVYGVEAGHLILARLNKTRLFRLGFIEMFLTLRSKTFAAAIPDHDKVSKMLSIL